MLNNLDEKVVENLKNGMEAKGYSDLDQFLQKVIDEININKNFEKVAEINKIEVNTVESISDHLNNDLDIDF